MSKNSEKSYYYQVQVYYPNQYIDLIHDTGIMAMEEFTCQGIEEFSLDEPRVDEILGERSYSGGDLPFEVLKEVEDITLKGSEQSYKYYFYGDEAHEKSQAFTEFIELNFPEAKLDRLQKEEQDWNQEWKKHYAPIWIDQSLEIVPAFFTDYCSKADNTLLIEPGMGFGTGGHETTFLCLKLFCSLTLQKPISILDFGAGSGILGLAADKMRMASKLDLYDIDLEAMKNAQHNTELNQLGKSTTRYLLPKNRNSFYTNYELIFANILLPVLKEERDALINLTAKGNYLILSGVLNEQTAELKDCYLNTGKVQLVEELSKNDWAAILFKRL